MGQYDDIIASYLDKQANLRAQLKLLTAIAERDDQKNRGPVRAAIQRIEHEIGDLDAAINRCRAKSEQTQRLPSSSALPIVPRQDGNGQLGEAAMTHMVFRCHKAQRVIATG